MKKFFSLLSVFAVLMLATPAAAQEGSVNRPDGFGIGLGQGTYVSGISLKSHLGATALQGVVGYGYYGFGFSGDYLWNMPTLVRADPLDLAWNIGVGGSLIFGDGRWGRRGGWYYPGHDRRGYVAAHVAFVAGLEFILPDIPLDFVIEARPNLILFPRVWLHFTGGAHVRIYL